MADAPLDQRRFNDDEVRAILKKAVEKASSTALTHRDGLSLAELKTIGEEVGIDPARLEEAARAVIQGGGRRAGGLVGGPTVVNFERTVSTELRPEDTPDVLSVIRTTMGTQGEVDEIHGSLEWRTSGDGGERYVTLSPRDGATTIRSSANLTNAAILTYLPTGIVGVIAASVSLIEFAKDGATGALVLGLTLVPVLYAILRTVFGAYSAKQSDRAERVVDELARLMEGE